MTDGRFLYDDINDCVLQPTLLISSIFTKTTFDLKKSRKNECYICNCEFWLSCLQVFHMKRVYLPRLTWTIISLHILKQTNKQQQKDISVQRQFSPQRVQWYFRKQACPEDSDHHFQSIFIYYFPTSRPVATLNLILKMLSVVLLQTKYNHIFLYDHLLLVRVWASSCPVPSSSWRRGSSSRIPPAERKAFMANWRIKLQAPK